MNRPPTLLPILIAAAIACMTGSQPACAQISGLSSKKWHHLKSEHFDMLTCAAAEPAKALLIHLEQFRAAYFDLIQPGRAHEEKMTIVLFETQKQFDAHHPHKGCVGSFDKTPIDTFVVLSGQHRGARNTIVHEYVHAIVNDRFKGIALCFNEGLTTFFGATSIRADTVRFGQESLGYVKRLRGNLDKMIPLESLLRTTHGSPNYRDEKLRPMFYAQAWLFMHYLLAGKHDGPKADAIDKFTALSKNKKVPLAEAFKEAFGVSMVEMDGALRRYLISGEFGTVTLPSPALPIAAKITINPADKLVVEYALDVLTPRSHKHGPNVDNTKYYRALSQWAEKTAKTNPEHLAPRHRLAAIAIQRRDPKQAAGHLQQAVNLGSDNAKIHLSLAALRARDKLTPLPRPGAHMPAGFTAELRQLLDKATALDPDYIEAHEARLVVESYSENMRIKVINEALAAIGPHRDRHPLARAALAHILWRQKDHADSRKMVDTLLPELDATATSRPPTPMDFSFINHTDATRRLDKLLADAGHPPTQPE